MSYPVVIIIMCKYIMFGVSPHSLVCKAQPFFRSLWWSTAAGVFHFQMRSILYLLHQWQETYNCLVCLYEIYCINYLPVCVGVALQIGGDSSADVQTAMKSNLSIQVVLYFSHHLANINDIIALPASCSISVSFLC